MLTIAGIFIYWICEMSKTSELTFDDTHKDLIAEYLRGCTVCLDDDFNTEIKIPSHIINAMIVNIGRNYKMRMVDRLDSMIEHLEDMISGDTGFCVAWFDVNVDEIWGIICDSNE